jgi:CDGSH-type Zn-finger protein
MTNPERATDTPFAIEVAAGNSYFWCTCGKSKKQPYCDGTHKGSEFSPLKITATETKTVYFCGCKATKTPPFCDGSHNS